MRNAQELGFWRNRRSLELEENPPPDCSRMEEMLEQKITTF
jgi:hypothetical protein